MSKKIDSNSSDTAATIEGSDSTQPTEQELMVAEVEVEAFHAEAVQPTPETPEQPTETERALIDIDSALASLPANSPIRATLLSEQERLIGVLAAEQDAAEAAKQQDSEIDSAIAAAKQFNLPDSVLTAMLAAITERYNATPEHAEAAPLPVSSRRQLSPVNAELNAAVAEKLAAESDTPLRRMAEAADAVMTAKYMALGCKARIEVGTRYSGLCGIVAGVPNWSTLKDLSAAIRIVQMERGMTLGSGRSTIDANWVAQQKQWALGTGNKADQSVTACFAFPTALYLCSDGLFRLLRNDSAEAKQSRMVRNDTAALNAWLNGNGATAEAAPAASGAALTAKQAYAGAAVSALSNCRHCGARNATTFPICRSCKAADWLPEAAD